MDILFFLFWFIYDESIDHLSYIYEKKYFFIYKKKHICEFVTFIFDVNYKRIIYFFSWCNCIAIYVRDAIPIKTWLRFLRQDKLIDLMGNYRYKDF